MEGDKSMEVKYYICKHCGNIVEKVKDKGVPVICCGEPMQELKAGVTDAAVEKQAVWKFQKEQKATTIVLSRA